jgi:nitroreductase
VTTNETERAIEQFGSSHSTDASSAVGAMAAIYQRRAVRSYIDSLVSREDVQLLVDAAVRAPSAVNRQPWAFAIVQDPAILARYAAEGKAHLVNEPPGIEVVESGLPDIDRLRQMAASTDFELFHGAPTVIVIYATSADGVPDCFLAGQNLMLAAWSLGLGTCPIGLARPLFNQAQVKDELKVSTQWECALPLALGWPNGETAPTSRRPAQIVSWK